MGISPIDFTEIKNYSEITNTRLTPWDARMLRHLSCAYVDQHYESKKPQCTAPYEAVMTIEEKRAAVAAAFKTFGKRAN